MDKGTKLRFAISAVFILALLIAANIIDSQPKQGADLCTGKPGGNVAILLDYSDKIYKTTHSAIQNRVQEIINDDSKVKPNDRVSVFLLTDDLTKVEPVFSFCRPITGGNPLTSNPMVQEAFLKFFEKRLQEGMNKKPDDVANSPIIEMVSTIGRTSFFNDNRRSLIIFSDLLQYSKNSVNLYTACNGNSSAAHDNGVGAFKQYINNSKAYPPLFLQRNVLVELHQIPRPDIRNIQLGCLTSFWQDAFGQSTPFIIPLP